jgi:cytoskeleton protein RodZ
MTKGTFGDNLKREREMRGVSLDEISAATRIATRFLQAIENEQWDQLPGGVFNRGFVRAVAHYLGLDEENIVAEYALAVDDSPSVPVWTGRPPAVVPDQRWLAWAITAVILIALIAGGWYGTRRILAWRAARHAAGSAPLNASPGSAPQPETPTNVTSSNAPTIASTDTATSPAPPTGATPAAAPIPSDAAPAVFASASDIAPMELKIETVKKTKVTVEADDARVFNGTVQAGENHTFSAKGRFQISARDAGALVLQLNGKTLAPVGPLGHAGKITLTRETLKGVVGGQN